MGLIGRQHSSGAFLKLDDISSQFNGSTTTFNLTLGGQSFYAGNPFTLLVSLAGVVQEPNLAFTISENQINFASAPASGADFFVVVLATTNVESLRSLTIGRRSGSAVNLDLHGRTFSVKLKDGTNHPVGFNLA